MLWMMRTSFIKQQSGTPCGEPAQRINVELFRSPQHETFSLTVIGWEDFGVLLVVHLDLLDPVGTDTDALGDFIYERWLVQVNIQVEWLWALHRQLVACHAYA